MIEVIPRSNGETHLRDQGMVVWLAGLGVVFSLFMVAEVIYVLSSDLAGGAKAGLAALSVIVLAFVLWQNVYRGFTAGAYISDRGIRVVNTFRTRRHSWSRIKGVSVGRWLWYEVPQIDLDDGTRSVILVLKAGSMVRPEEDAVAFIRHYLQAHANEALPTSETNV